MLFAAYSTLIFSDVTTETYLSEGSVIGRLFKRNLDPTLGLTLAFFNSNLFVVSVQSDGKIRIWSAAVCFFIIFSTIF